MTMATRAGSITIAAVALGIGLSACGSDKTSGEATTSPAAIAETSAATSSSAAPTTSAQAANPLITIPEYIKENNIVENPVKRGDPGAPTIDLPFPEGWEDLGANTPEWAYGGIAFTADPAMAENPPTVMAIVSKLTGNVDPAKILEYAPNELRKMPGFEGPEAGKSSKLSGFDAVQIGGTYVKDGVTHLVAQKTVVIPGQDGLYVLQLNAEGTEDQAGPLMDATAEIDDQTTITP